MKKLSTAWRY